MTGLTLPRWRGTTDDAHRVVRDIDAWAASEELASLVSVSGAVVSATGAARLDQFAVASQFWDARGGRERDQAAVAEPSADLARLVLGSAPALGLADRSEPRSSHYDAVVMTGGMVRAEIVKPRFARQLLDDGLAAGELTFLGAFREFSREEIALAEALGIRSRDEVDAMGEGLDRTFGPLGPPTRDGNGRRGASGWRSESWRSGTTRLGVLAAPSSDPLHRRADTADTFRFWADRFLTDRNSHAASVLIITTAVYVPYQAAVAVRTLGVERGLTVETVGVTDAASDLGEHTQRFLPQQHLQELRSAILAMRSLRATLADRLTYL